MTQVLQLDEESPQQEAIERAASIIRNGGLVAFPTETVYGLGADAMNESSVEKIFEAKSRPADNPLIVHVCEQAVLDLRKLKNGWSVYANRCKGEITQTEGVNQLLKLIQARGSLFRVSAPLGGMSET